MAWPLLLAASLCLPQVHVDNNGKATEAARAFVQRFYAWYVPVALRAADNLQPAWPVALKDRGPAFSRDLRKALTDDAEAQAKVKGYIVGLDFDPFLNTQDPCDSYEVGAVTHGEGRYLVEIYAVCSGKRSKKPSVIAELARENGSWIFVNFHYPGNGPDLLRNLRLLRKDRQKSSR